MVRRTTHHDTSGSFNYLADTVAPSLYRNGKVLTVRDADGNDSGTTGMALNSVDLDVRNARAMMGDKAPTCHANGFEGP